MRKSNWVYVLHQTFATDLLFWIVIGDLFLLNVKGLSEFDVVLVTTVGIAVALALYPLINLIVKKTSSKVSIILASICQVLATILFMNCTTIYGFIVAKALYTSASPFRAVSNVMLKNNLAEKGNEGSFVKWQSYGRLGYAFITLAISLVAGWTLNVYSYLPMLLTLGLAVLGLVFAIIYKDAGCAQTEDGAKQGDIRSLIKYKPIILVVLMNLIGVGAYVFMHTRVAIVIEYVLDGTLDIALINIIVSGLVFGSRLMRVLSMLIFPKIYSRVKIKSKILIAVSILIVAANAFLAVGGLIGSNYILSLICLAIGFFIILGIRDVYSVAESRIIATSLPEQKLKQAFMLTSVAEKAGRLISHAFALLVLGFLPTSFLYLFMMIFSVAQIFICLPLAKYFKE